MYIYTCILSTSYIYIYILYNVHHDEFRITMHYIFFSEGHPLILNHGWVQRIHIALNTAGPWWPWPRGSQGMWPPFFWWTTKGKTGWNIFCNNNTWYIYTYIYIHIYINWLSSIYICIYIYMTINWLEHCCDDKPLLSALSFFSWLLLFSISSLSPITTIIISIIIIIAITLLSLLSL